MTTELSSTPPDHMVHSTFTVTYFCVAGGDLEHAEWNSQKEQAELASIHGGSIHSVYPQAD